MRRCPSPPPGSTGQSRTGRRDRAGQRLHAERAATAWQGLAVRVGTTAPALTALVSQFAAMPLPAG